MIRKRQHQAYTLIEILIALFIFSIVSMIVVMVMHNIVSVRDRIAEKSNQLASLQKALTIIARDIEQTVNRRIRNETGQIEPALLGDNEQPLGGGEHRTDPAVDLRRPGWTFRFS